MAALQRIGGRYTLRERIGAGGMGEVWLARDEGPEGFQKTVVVKRMLPEAASYLDYFKAEARLVAQLPHQNITQVLNYFVDEDGQHNIVMEFVEGYRPRRSSSSRIVGGSPSTWRSTSPPKCCVGSTSHTRRASTALPAGLVHRDVSPHNILVSYGGEVKITDFGIAKAELEYRQKTQGNKFRGKLAYAAARGARGARSTPIAAPTSTRSASCCARCSRRSAPSRARCGRRSSPCAKVNIVPHCSRSRHTRRPRSSRSSKGSCTSTASSATRRPGRLVRSARASGVRLGHRRRPATRLRPARHAPQASPHEPVSCNSDGTGAPMMVREEGSPLPIPTLI